MPDGHSATKTVKYGYDYLNRRTEKQIKSTDESGKKTKSKESYTYLGHDIVLQQNDGEQSHRYLHHPDIIDQCLADENIFDDNVLYPLFDNLNSVRDLVDYDPETNTSSVANSIDYNASGLIVHQTDDTITIIFGFTGQETDLESGFYHFDRRPYDPYLQVFAATDPIAFAAHDTNLYRYVGNSPTNFTDPFGTDLRQDIENAAWLQWLALQQGGANVLNGVQDAAIGTLNLPAMGINGIAWTEEKLGILDEGDAVRVPYIPSPDWSRGLVIEEAGGDTYWGDMHGWSKFSGGSAIELLIGAKGLSKASMVDDGLEAGARMAGSYSDNLADDAARSLDDLKALADEGAEVADSVPVKKEVLDVGDDMATSGSTDDFFSIDANSGKGITAEISDDGIVTFMVEAGEGSPVRGTEMFRNMMDHFGMNVKGVEGRWFYGDNLAEVNRLTAAQHGLGWSKPAGYIDLTEAAAKTWTGRRAASYGFGKVRVVEILGESGKYTKVIVVFE